MRIPELLAPAGNMDALRAALHFGADAVYGGMKHFGLRAFAGNFGPDELREAVRETHAAGRKFYVTMNIYPFDDELEAFGEAAKEAADCGVDAAIVADPGAIRFLRAKVPGLPIHVSTQANTLNAPAAELYRELGCERVILAREMSLERIRALKQKVGDGIQLETFVHGASCMAYSGRCMLSAYLTGRSGNRGECAQPCRWQYAVMEEKRPGEYLPVAEDERGTYLFSARDLCLMPLLPELCDAGVASLKIEGRMKTEYYVAVVTGAYRRALDLLGKDREAFREVLRPFARHGERPRCVRRRRTRRRHERALDRERRNRDARGLTLGGRRVRALGGRHLGHRVRKRGHAADNREERHGDRAFRRVLGKVERCRVREAA